MQHSPADLGIGAGIRLSVMSLNMDHLHVISRNSSDFLTLAGTLPWHFGADAGYFPIFVFCSLFQSFTALMLPLLYKSSSLLLFMNIVKICSLNGFNVGCHFQGNSK